MRIRINNDDENYYHYLGPLFGSRKVQRETKDRFYDDPGKEWLIHIDINNNVDSALSVNGGIIRNIYSENHKETIKTLKNIYTDVYSGIVPSIYRDLYEKAGYQIVDINKINFIEIRGGKSESD